MRIVYIHQHYSVPQGQYGGRPHETAKRLAARGHDVHLVSATSDPASPSVERVGDVHVHWVPVEYSNHMGYSERILAFARFAVKASMVARRIRGDVVLASSTPLTTIIPGFAAIAFRGKPLVFEVRDLWPDAPIAMGALNNPLLRAAAHSLERFAYAVSAHVIALSPGMAEGVLRNGGRVGQVTVVPNASDNEFFTVPEERGRSWRAAHPEIGYGPLVLYGGTLGKVNDVGYLASVAGEMAAIDPDVRFVVVGSGNDEAQVRERAESLGVLDRTFFMLPPVDKNEMADVFSAADVSISTVAPIKALNANSANKVFDTLAAARPLAVNHEGWLADMIRATRCGVVLPQSDYRAAAEELASLLRDSGRLHSARTQAKHLATTVFDRDRLVAKVANVLESVGAGRRPTTAAHLELELANEPPQSSPSSIPHV